MTPADSSAIPADSPATSPVSSAIPPVSRASQPRFASRERRDELADAFAETGADYDRLRPGYPDEVVEAIVAALPDGDRASTPDSMTSRVVVDLGAGTGKLSLALASRGVEVIAVDPSESMLRVLGASAASASSAASGVAEAPYAPIAPDAPAALDAPIAPDAPAAPDASDAPVEIPSNARGSVRTVVGTAEATGLADGSVEAVASAQAWHWFDTEAASAEARRLLKPGGVLALVWNTMDVQIPWVHRFSRIMHAGDVQKDDFAPPVAGGFELVERIVVRWEDPMPTQDLIDLARTRSYVITASEATRAKVLGNLDWYLHEHLGHAPGAVVGLPYRTDLFLFRAG